MCVAAHSVYQLTFESHEIYSDSNHITFMAISLLKPSYKLRPSSLVQYAFAYL